MVMPTLSVTAIGGVAAVLAMSGGTRPLPAVLRGVLGAWIGFLAGGFVGVLIDVALGEGVYLAVLGHAGAVLGAYLALRGVRGREAAADRLRRLAHSRRDLR